MKWIGQHIWDYISRFRNDIYLESISSGTIASGGHLGLDSDNKIVKAAVSSGGISHDGSTADGILTYKDADEATVEQYLTFANNSNISTLSLLSDQDTGDKFTIATTTHGASTLTTVDDDSNAANLNFVIDGYVDIQSTGTYLATTDHQGIRITNEDTVVASDVTTKPRFIVKNTTDDASSPRIILMKRRENGSGTLQPGEDGDGCGKITFNNYDDNSPTPGGKVYSTIETFIHDATNNEESGQLKLGVSAHDGDIEDGVVLTGGSADAEVDVTVGKGVNSVTTIAGHLSSTGNIDIAASKSFSIDGSAILHDSSGTLTLREIDALDATTEATIESAIDTLSNLTAASSLATVGTITSGTWQGTAIASTYIADDAVTFAKAQGVTPNVFDNKIKLIPSDFMANDDGGNTKFGVGYVETPGTAYGMRTANNATELYAFVSIPQGMTATHVDIFDKNDLAVEVFEAQINATTMTSKGSGNPNTTIDITDVASSATNFLVIEVTTTSATNDKVYGGTVTLA